MERCKYVAYHLAPSELGSLMFKYMLCVNSLSNARSRLNKRVRPFVKLIDYDV